MNLFEAIFKAEWLDRTAVRFDQRQITYRDLRGRTLDIARAFAALPIESGDRVALLLNDSPEFISSFIAICSSGAIAVPVNMGLRFDEQVTILKDCAPRAVIAEADLCEKLAGESFATVEHVIAVSRTDKATELTTETQRAQRLHREDASLLTLDEFVENGRSGAVPEFSNPSDEPAFILYTSGSTGEPKGAMHRQQDIFYTNQTYCRQVLQLREGDRLFSSSRLPFAYGLGNSFTFPLLNGCTTILCREKPAAEVIARIFREDNPTIFFAVPVVYRLLLDYHAGVSSLDCSRLRLSISAGEALPAHLGEEWERAFGVPILDGIGSTEMLHMWMSNHQGEVRYGSSGKLLAGYEAMLLDADDRAAGESSEGNLWVKGASAALGYWKKPEVTARTFVDGWVRTGDVYRRDADGYWYHLGRSDDCFKSSGQWVSPVEVEGALLGNDGVSAVAVVEDFDEHSLPCPCAFVVPKDTSSTEQLEKELRDQMRATLPRFKQPRRYVFVNELPYTATGKIQRFKLREKLKGSPKSNVQSPKSSSPA